MRFLSLLIVSLTFANAQPSQPMNLLTVPGCSTAYTIVNSCARKLQASATITSVVWSCVCYDNSGNYVPTSYDNAASSCSSFLTNVYHTTGNPFLQYIAGFCTDPSYAPATTTTVPTKGSSASASLTPVVSSQAGPTSVTVVANPGATRNSTSSQSTSTAATSSQPTSITDAPATPTGSGSGTGAAGSAVSSTSSKAEGAMGGYFDSERSFWSFLAAFAGAVLFV